MYSGMIASSRNHSSMQSANSSAALGETGTSDWSTSRPSAGAAYSRIGVVMLRSASP